MAPEGLSTRLYGIGEVWLFPEEKEVQVLQVSPRGSQSGGMADVSNVVSLELVFRDNLGLLGSFWA